jgi:hypothetical protein
MKESFLIGFLVFLMAFSLAPAVFGENEASGGSETGSARKDGAPPLTSGERVPPGSLQGGAPPFKRTKMVTPYGDFCPRCTFYGVGSRPVQYHEAMEALKDYFDHKGLHVGNVNMRGRFVRADIFMMNGTMVDKIIFDRRSGRIRSIY